MRRPWRRGATHNNVQTDRELLQLNRAAADDRSTVWTLKHFVTRTSHVLLMMDSPARFAIALRESARDRSVL